MKHTRPPVFEDRSDAGRRLAEAVARMAYKDPVVLALPRGGVPVGHEIARELGVELDVLLVRKLGAPGRPELAIGAIGEGHVKVINHDLVSRLGVDDRRIELTIDAETAELERGAMLYRGNRPMTDVRGRTAIVVDDGVATGATARAGCAVARELGAAIVVLAVPVAPFGWSAPEVDELIAVVQPVDLRAVGSWYADFDQVDDGTVQRLLK